MVLRYPGSKSRKLSLLRPYVEWLVQGETKFADVCVGSGSILIHIARQCPILRLFANDIDPLIVAFWRSVVDSDLMEALCDKLKVKPTHETRARLLAGLPDDPAELAWAAVVLTRTSYSGILQIQMFNGGRDGSRVKRIDNRYNPEFLIGEVRRYHKLLAGRTTVTQMDAGEFAKAHRTTAMFIDLPYYEIGADLYRHAPMAAEHAAIARIIRRCRKALLTYDATPAIEALYADCEVDRLPVKYYAGRNPGRNYSFRRDEELVISV